MANTKPKHGGKREGAGRPPRPELKAKPIWCGQMQDWERDLIITELTPEERYEALMKAVREKQNDQ